MESHGDADRPAAPGSGTGHVRRLPGVVPEPQAPRPDLRQVGDPRAQVAARGAPALLRAVTSARWCQPEDAHSDAAHTRARRDAHPDGDRLGPGPGRLRTHAAGRVTRNAARAAQDVGGAAHERGRPRPRRLRREAVIGALSIRSCYPERLLAVRVRYERL